MGPWSHGDWAGEKGFQAVNHIYFGDSISTYYQKEIEFEFFNSVLKENRNPKLPEASISSGRHWFSNCSRFKSSKKP